MCSLHNGYVIQFFFINEIICYNVLARITAKEYFKYCLVPLFLCIHKKKIITGIIILLLSNEKCEQFKQGFQSVVQYV